MSSSSEHETELEQIISQAQRVYQHAKVLSLATIDENGDSYSTPVYFCHGNGLELYFFSDATTKHVKHLETNSRISVSLYKEQHSVDDLAGVQLKGECCKVVDDCERNVVESLYTNKFPFLKEKELLLERLKQHELYKVTPSWLKITDNQVKFGYKLEVEL